MEWGSIWMGSDKIIPLSGVNFIAYRYCTVWFFVKAAVISRRSNADCHLGSGQGCLEAATPADEERVFGDGLSGDWVGITQALSISTATDLCSRFTETIRRSR